jgi:cytochrome P450
MKNIEVDLASPEFKADPYPFFARLREQAPVCRVALPGGQAAWLITRYEDVAAALKEERLAKDRSKALTPDQAARQPWIPGMFKPLTRNMLDLDPPDHTRLRGLVQKAFTPRLVERMRVRAQSLTEELLDAALRRRRADLIRDYALPLPTTIIAEMLGVPAEDRHRFHRYESPLATATERFAREDIVVAGVTIPRGGLVYAVLASANRDPRQFPDPDTLDLAREPNKHLAFGLGIHYCLGAPLARLEGEIAISTLLRRAPGLRLSVAPQALR